MIDRIFDKLADYVFKYGVNIAERNTFVIEILAKLGILELKPDFDHIYAHTLINYWIKREPAELVKLFACKEVRDSLKSELYNQGKEKFSNTVKGKLHKELNSLESWDVNSLKNTIFPGNHLTQNVSSLATVRR